MSFSDRVTLKVSFEKHPKFNVTIRREDLFNSGAQVIVNAANIHLGGGGGIDGAIHQQGGGVYKKAHKALQEKYEEKYTSGYAAMITSGALKENYGIDDVIVIAGPQGGNVDKKKEQELYSCYYNSLVLAHINHKTSIAFPSISTGIFNFNKERAASISLKALLDFVKKYPNSPLTTISIHFLSDNQRQDLQDLKTYQIVAQ